MTEKNKEIPVILVTAIGTATASTIVTELKELNTFKIIGTDIFPSYEVVTSKDVDEFVKAPSSVDDQQAFLNFVTELCRTKSVDYYFPVIDEEVANLSNYRGVFDSLDVKLCIPNSKMIDICHNKRIFAEWCEEQFPEIAIHCFNSKSDVSDLVFPLFVKPIFGRASNGCNIIRTYDDLLKYASEEALDYEYIIQEYVFGEIVTIDVVRNGTTNEFKAIPRLELLRNNNGCGTAVKLFYDQNLIDLCQRISEDLELDGVVNFEFIQSSEGYKLIEINPRFSAGAVFSCMAGAHLVNDALNIVDGKNLSNDDIRFDTYFAKRYEAYELE